MKKSKMKKTNKIALLAFSLVWIISLASIATYSWIARNWTPSLEYSEITIATSGALVITMEDKDGNEGTYNEVNLNTFSGVESFTLKQVSSANGRSFVGADFSPVISGGKPVYSQDVDGKYLEVDFYLAAQPSEDTSIINRKQVFLHADTTIEYLKDTEESESTSSETTSTSEEASSSVETSASDSSSDSSTVETFDTASAVEHSIRFSIDAPGFNNENPYILCKKRKDAEENQLIYQQLKAAATNDYANVVGQLIYADYPTSQELNTSALSTQLAYDYKYFDGGKDELGNDKVLFTIDQSKSQKVTLRIWLEGCDEHCVSEIAGEKLKLVVKFDSKDIETTDSEVTE